jgi:ribosomal protein L18
LPAGAALETSTFEDLFAWRGRLEDPSMDDDEREDVRRHRHLRRVLEGNLTDRLVVRIGVIQIHVFLVGQTACGELAGVSTISIET